MPFWILGMLILKKMKKTLKHLLRLQLIHEGNSSEILDLIPKIIFLDLKICDLSSPIYPRFLFSFTAEDLFNFMTEDFVRFQDFRIFLFNILAEDFKIFLFSILAEDFLQDFQDLSTDTTVLQRLKICLRMIFLPSIIAKDFLQDFQDLAADTIVLLRLKTFTVHCCLIIF